METSLKIDAICRVCLEVVPVEKENFKNLQENAQNLHLSYSEIFDAVSGHSLDLEHEPQKLCVSCGDRLIAAFELRQLCDRAQQLLKSHQDDGKSELNIELYEHDDHFQDASESEEEQRKPRKKYECEICRRPLANLAHYRAHYASHSEARQCSCPNCLEKIFKPFFEAHKKRCRKQLPSKKPKNEKKLCPICGIFRSKKHVQEHIDRSNNVDSNGDVISRPFTCDLCGRQTASRNNMFLHMQTMHLRIMMKCKHCKAEFKNRGRLETHMRKIHTEIKGLLECKFCEYRAVDRSTLHVHLKKHTGQKSHRCEICHHEFITKTKWRDHLATHSSERPFSCETCNASFKTRKTLNSHKKIHQAHDYECPVCSHTYQTSHQLRLHVTKNHKEYKLPPPGTVLSKSWRKRKAEQEMKDLAMKQGADQKEIDGIVVQEPPPIEEKQYFQGFG